MPNHIQLTDNPAGEAMDKDGFAPLTPFPDCDTASVVPNTQPAPSMLSPKLHMDFLTWNFVTLHDTGGVPHNLKEQSVDQLNNIALTSALILTIEATVVFELREVLQDTSEWLGFAMGLISMCALVIQITSLGHAIFHLAMISEFGSLDELACWMDSIGSLQTLPAMLLMVGIWLTVVSFILFLFAIYPVTKACIITAAATAFFGLGHVAVAKVLQSYYDAVDKVSKGWRISKKID